MSSAREPLQWACDVAVPAQHPAFAGHFPGAPVLPGAVLLTLVLEALADAPGWAPMAGQMLQIEHVKFLAPVLPGQALRINLQGVGAAVNFEIRCLDQVVTRGRLSVANSL